MLYNLYMMDMCLKMDVISDILHNNQVYVYMYMYTPDIAQKKDLSKIQNDEILKSSLYFTRSKE